MRDQFNSFSATITGFIAGALAVPIFHQVAQLIAFKMGIFPFAPYNMQPTNPLGIPHLLSISFWGGIWGIIFAYTIFRMRGLSYWFWSIVGGAVLLSVVAAFIVSPLKDMGMMWEGNLAVMVFALYVNAAWGLGTAVIYSLLNR